MTRLSFSSNPDRPKSHRDFDIRSKLGLQFKSVEAESHRISREDYLQMLRTLNVKQKEFFVHVLHWV